MLKSINESFNLEQYVVSYMGTRRIWGLPESVAVTIVYSIILVTGVIGNVLTCVVIRKNAYMHTATNFYLFSLATSDILSVVWGKLVYFLSIFARLNYCLEKFTTYFWQSQRAYLEAFEFAAVLHLHFLILHVYLLNLQSSKFSACLSSEIKSKKKVLLRVYRPPRKLSKHDLFQGGTPSSLDWGEYPHPVLNRG